MKKLLILLILPLLISISTQAQKATMEYEAVETEAADLSMEDLVAKAEANPKDLSANYNLASRHYNMGVEKLSKLDFTAMSTEEVKSAQERIMKHFEEALPYAQKSHEIEPSHKPTLQMLSGIYFGLNQIEQSKHYDQLLQEAE